MSYVRNAWYVASWTQDLAANKPLGLTILDEPIVIWRDSTGNVHALEDRCVHRLAPLSLGRCEAGKLRCMYHGFLFDTDGRVVQIPGQTEIPSIARVKTYPVVEQDSWVWIWMGTPGQSDETLIPRVKGLDERDWKPNHGVLDYAAEARLINDNLTDLSHLPFVHGTSFAATEDYAHSLPVVTALENGVRIQRWVERQPPLGVPEATEEQLFDAYLAYDYLVPGIFSFRARSFPVGTFKKLGLNGVVPPDDLECEDLWGSQAATPLGKGKSRYFFSQGPQASAPPEVVDFLWDVTLKAFAEDRAMIEGQQRVLDMTPDPRIMPAAGDKGTVLYNRLVERLVRKEGEGGLTVLGRAILTAE